MLFSRESLMSSMLATNHENGAQAGTAQSRNACATFVPYSQESQSCMQWGVLFNVGRQR